ncbi:MAG: discoidin domain-containing protein [Thermoproteota archaeon]|nr:discoidin domain-containing protein [Thermoproteota archaeon]
MNSILVASFLVLILVVVAELNLSNAFAKSNEAKGAQSASVNSGISIPPVKLSYGGHTYEMLPFVMVAADQVKKLNFPQLPDDFQPVVKIPSKGTFTFDFSEKPRETNAFVIDYDADTTATSPVNNLGKNSYSVSDVYGPKTLEVRAIYPDGKYVTYTLLIDISRIGSTSGFSHLPTNSIGSVSVDGNGDANGNNININPNNINTHYSNANGLPSTIEDRIIREYSGMIKMDRPITLSQQSIQTSNGCIDSEIPVSGVSTNDKSASSNSTNRDTVSKPNSPWVQLDLGSKQQTCGVKVQFRGGAEDIKFFTVELSVDGIVFSAPKFFSNTGSSSSAEIYNFHDGPVSARYIKLTELGKNGSDSGWVSDVKVLGPKN